MFIAKTPVGGTEVRISPYLTAIWPLFDHFFFPQSPARTSHHGECSHAMQVNFFWGLPEHLRVSQKKFGREKPSIEWEIAKTPVGGAIWEALPLLKLSVPIWRGLFYTVSLQGGFRFLSNFFLQTHLARYLPSKSCTKFCGACLRLPGTRHKNLYTIGLVLNGESWF
jgi:hypothetical protein